MERAMNEQANTAEKVEVQPYAGAWTAEEKEYAEALIQDFRDGILEGLADKSTLRNYLSEKLGCLTKRISKKYEKSGYNGRLQYKNGIAGMDAEEVKKRQEHLKQLEEKFRESREAILQLRGSSTGAAPLRAFSTSHTKSSGQGQSQVPANPDSKNAATSIAVASESKTLPALSRTTNEGLLSRPERPNLPPSSNPPSAPVEAKPDIANSALMRAMLQQSMQRDITAVRAAALLNMPSIAAREEPVLPLARTYLGGTTAGLGLAAGGTTALNPNLLALRAAATQNQLSSFFPSGATTPAAGTIGSSLSSSTALSGGAAAAALRQTMLLRQKNALSVSLLQGSIQSQQKALAELLQRKRELTQQEQEQSSAKRPRYLP